jgi:hypothetical protein
MENFVCFGHERTFSEKPFVARVVFMARRQKGRAKSFAQDNLEFMAPGRHLTREEYVSRRDQCTQRQLQEYAIAIEISNPFTSWCTSVLVLRKQYLQGLVFCTVQHPMCLLRDPGFKTALNTRNGQRPNTRPLHACSSFWAGVRRSWPCSQWLRSCQAASFQAPLRSAIAPSSPSARGCASR